MGSIYILVILASALTCLTFPPLSLGFLAFLIWVPLFVVFTKTKRLLTISLLGLLYGFIISMVYTRWMISLNEWAPLPIIISLWCCLSLYSGLFFLFQFMMTYFLKNKLGLLGSSISSLILIEYLKQLGPFGIPIGILGYSQVYNTFLLPISSVFGVIGISVFILLVNYFLFKLIQKSSTI